MTILTIDQLTKRQGNMLLLPTINLQVASGQCVVVQCNNELGHLFIKLLLGLAPASSGLVRFEGVDFYQDFKKHAHKIGISLLHDGIYERLKVKDYLAFYKELYNGSASIQDVLGRIGLANKQNSKVSTLTFSEKKRLQLGRTIIHNPSLIIWEEPEQNVDIESHIIIRALIVQLQQEGKAILITTAYLADAISIATDIYRLDEHAFKKVDIIEDSEADSNDQPAPSSAANEAEQQVHNERTELAVLGEDEALNEHEEHEERKEAEAHENHAELDDIEEQHSVDDSDKDIKQQVETDRAAMSPLTSEYVIAQPVRVEKIPAKVEDKIILFDPTEILFIESSDGVSMLHVKGETFPCTFTLNDLEQKLRPFGFFRCHRSYIVNLQKVREVITWTRNSYSLILEDDKKSSIPLSKGKFDELKGVLGI